MKKLLLLTALAVTVSMGASAQVRKIVKADLSKMEKRLSPLANQKEERPVVKTHGATVLRKKSDFLGVKNFQNPTVRDTETEETGELVYLTPNVTFYTWGDEDGYIYPYAELPAYANLTWTNFSTGIYKDAPCEWSYSDVEGEDATATTTDLVAPHWCGVGEAPVLTSGDASYQLSVDGEPYGIFYGLDYRSLDLETDACLFDQFLSTDVQDFGYYYMYAGGVDVEEVASEEWIEYMDGLYEDAGVSFASARPVAFANFVPQPASPYVLRSVTFVVGLTTTAATELTLNLYTPGESGSLQLLSSSSVKVPVQAWGYTELKFPIRVQDPATGLVRSSATVSTPLIVELSGFADNENIAELFPMTVAHETSYAQTMYPFLGMTAVEAVATNGQKATVYEDMPNWGYYADESRTAVVYPSQFVMAFDLYYPFLALFDPDKDFQTVMDDVVSVELPKEGGMKYYQAYSYDCAVDEEADPADWTVVDGDDNDELPEWLTVTAENEEVDGEVYSFVSFEADELPADVAGRKVVIKIEETGGAVRKFVVSQGEVETGINSIEAAAGNAGVAAVYTIEGKQVANTENLGKGVYIVKKTDGSAVKVVKK